MKTIPPLKRADPMHEQLRKLGLRPTSARLFVLQILHQAGREALPAERIFILCAELGISVSLGTIYRVLSEFEQRGMVQKEWRSQTAMAKACYRLTVGGPALPACRFVCPLCGAQHAVTATAFLEMLQQLAQTAGFDRGLASATIGSVCNQCAAV